jgi:hypothetical protein
LLLEADLTLLERLDIEEKQTSNIFKKLPDIPPSLEIATPSARNDNKKEVKESRIVRTSPSS